MGIFEKFTDRELAFRLAYEISLAGGKAYYVGGYVRDSYLGINDNKDIDIEVYNITVDKLRTIIDKFGERLEHGKSFGVFGIKGYNIDISLPRTERCTGDKHTDFDININPFMSVEDGAKRRDLTINAMMYDILTNTLVDPFNGKEDLDNGIIRYVNSDTFIEDPLRVLRVAQFAARFPEMYVSPETIELCSKIDLSTLSKERVYTELNKALTKSNQPSIFFNTLRQMNQLSTWFPEVEQMIGVPQNSKYHKEGDVYIHTMMVLDYVSQFFIDIEQPVPLMLSALCHDMGKIKTTEIMNGEIHSYKHEIMSTELAFNALSRLTNEVDVIDYVLNMVKLHMKPHHLFKNQSKIKKTNKLFDESISPDDLIILAYCDSMSAKKEDSSEIELAESEKEFLNNRYEIYVECMNKPFVRGQDLVEQGLKPGKYFAEALDFAHKLRLAGISKENALPQVIALAKKLYKSQAKIPTIRACK